MRRFWLVLIFLGLLIPLASGTAIAATSQVDVLRVDGTINPVVAGYIDRGIGLAEDHGASACIIEMDTPGGLDSSMRDIVQHMLEAGVPVGGLFTGSNEDKYESEATRFGGRADAPRDPNYHRPGDDLDNVDRHALEVTTEAITHAATTLSRDAGTLD